MKECPRDEITLTEQKLSVIKSLIDRKEFKQALAELSELESDKGLSVLLSESEEFCRLSALVFQGVGNYGKACSMAKRALVLLKSSSEIDKFAQAQYILGTIYFDMGELKNAERELRDAMACFRRLDDENGIIQVSIELAHLHFVRGEYSKAIEYLTECVAYCQERKHKQTKAKLLANLGRVHIRTGNWKEAETYLTISTTIHAESVDKLAFCNGLLSLGYAWFQQRIFGKAKECYEHALKLIYENNYTRPLAIHGEYAGELKVAERNYREAENHYLEALEIAAKIADASAIVSQSYRLLAELRIAEGQYDEALTCCKKGMKVARSLPERIEIGAIRRAAAQVYSAREDIRRARKNFKKSISILEEIGAKPELGKTYLEALKSNVFDHVDRIAHFAKSREIFKELGSDYYLAHASFAYSILLFENGEYDGAKIHIEEADNILRRLNEKKDLASVLELKRRIKKALGKISSLYTSARNEEGLPGIETQDPRVEELMQEAIKFKDSDEPILLVGETGTGKDRWAKGIHQASNRQNGPFVNVNCARIQENFLESELFGHKKGAFTGACTDKKGKFEVAEGGTIFLNEIDCLSRPLQAKILDSIEEKKITRLGENKPRKVDFRVIAAAGKDLREEVDKGNFREDLYQRLNMVELKLPPLRERKHDIIILIRRFLDELGVKENAGEGLEKSAQFKYLLSYTWSGNIRELWKGVKRVVQVLKPFDRQRFIEELSKWVRTRSKRMDRTDLRGKRAELERNEVLWAVQSCGGDKGEAGKLLGVSRSTVYRKIN